MNTKHTNILEYTNPELSSEWHPTKNLPLKPTDVTTGSNKKVWWLGPCGHEWEASIKERTSGYRCPYCSHRRILVGFNDLQTTNPTLAEEWHPTKNLPLKPTDVLSGSGKKAWWKCSICGHEWAAEINGRNKGRGCPRCSTAYGSSFPEQAIYYYIQKFFPDSENRYNQFGVEFDIFIPSIRTAIEYDGFTWHKNALERDNQKDSLCKENGMQLIRVREGSLSDTQSAYIIHRFNKDSIDELEQAIKSILAIIKTSNADIDIRRDRNRIIASFINHIKNDSLQVRCPELSREWNTEKNGSLTPSMVQYGSHLKVWWKCSVCGHEWETTIKHRCNGHGCPKCAYELKSVSVRQTKLRNGAMALSTLDPALAKEWHPSKNGDLSPRQVNANSKMKVWWLGPCGHEWEAPIGNRYHNKARCPYCFGTKTLAGFNDLQTTNPKVAEEWHPTKNLPLKPTDVRSGSGKKVWWLGPCGHEWEAVISNRTGGSGCPICAGRRQSPR